MSGTPARVEEIAGQLDPAALIARSGDKWTIKEQIGHLSDMEPLWLGRLDDLINGSAELRVADLTNQRTHTAGHNESDIAELLQAFREQRLR